MTDHANKAERAPDVRKNEAGKLIGWIGAAGALVVGLTYFLDAIPKLIDSGQKSYEAIHVLVTPPNSVINSYPGISPPISSNASTNTRNFPDRSFTSTEAAGPKPGADCVLASISDSAVIPPKYSYKWNCP